MLISELPLMTVYSMIIFFLTTLIPNISIPLRPFFVLNNYFHELSHAIFCLLTGGRVHKIEVYYYGGYIHLTDGNMFIVSMSGYFFPGIYNIISLFCCLNMRFLKTTNSMFSLLLLSFLFKLDNIRNVLLIFYFACLFITLNLFPEEIATNTSFILYTFMLFDNIHNITKDIIVNYDGYNDVSIMLKYYNKNNSRIPGIIILLSFISFYSFLFLYLSF